MVSGTYEVQDEDDDLGTCIHGRCDEVATANRLSGLWQLPELSNLLILDEPSRAVGT